MQETDILIIGAGSAGCALAGRLSEDPNIHVTLVEAGGTARYHWIDIPIGYFKTVGNPRFDWGFETEAGPGMDNRQLPWPRGKGLGGSSLINGMLYLRGHQADYDHWAELGNEGWSWQDVLPYFKKAQRREGASGDTIGKDGPLWVSDLDKEPVSDAFIAAAAEQGIPTTSDFNTGDNEGAGYFQMTTHKGRRMSTARAYITPVKQRPNLQVLTGWQARRVLFEGTRAVGAEFQVGGEQKTLKARKEVILCAGAIQSPQLLQLSGVGDPELLAQFDIPVVSPLKGVGQNMQDHLQVRPNYRCRQDVETLNDIANSTIKGAREFIKYVFAQKGALNDGVYRAGAFYKSSPEVAFPDVQIHFGLVSFDRPHQPPHPFPGITLSACILRPYSRGSLEICSADPLVPPKIHSGYLEDERDQKLAVSMVKKMRAIAQSGPLANLVEDEHEPGLNVEDDAALLQWVRERAGSIFHPVSTCAMGPDFDPMAVLDARLRVRGVQGLRVVDGASMPAIVSGNTNAPIIMMAEKAADLIKEEMANETL